MPDPSPTPRRVLVLGASGTIGRATVAALVARGHAVTALVRAGARDRPAFAGATVRVGEATDPATLADAVAGMAAVVSCLASRTGAPADAWAIDYAANRAALAAAQAAGVGHFVLLSAICVQKPVLAFQHAKLAFEAELRRVGPALDDRPPDRLLQVAVGPDRAGQGGQAVPRFRRR